MDFFQRQYDPQWDLKSPKKDLDRSVDEEIERCPATTRKWRPKTLLPDKKTKPRKVYKQRPAKCVLEQDSGDLSSSEKSEETLFKSEEEDTDYN